MCLHFSVDASLLGCDTAFYGFLGPDVWKGRSILKIKALGSFETSGPTQLTTECNIPEYFNLLEPEFYI